METRSKASLGLLGIVTLGAITRWAMAPEAPHEAHSEETRSFQAYVGYEACVVMRRLEHKTPGQTLEKKHVRRWTDRGGGGPVRIRDVQRCALSYERPCNFWWSEIEGKGWQWKIETQELSEDRVQLTLKSRREGHEPKMARKLKIHWGTRIVIHVAEHWFSVHLKPCI